MNTQNSQSEWHPVAGWDVNVAHWNISKIRKGKAWQHVFAAAEGEDDE